MIRLTLRFQWATDDAVLYSGDHPLLDYTAASVHLHPSAFDGQLPPETLEVLVKGVKDAAG